MPKPTFTYRENDYPPHWWVEVRRQGELVGSIRRLTLSNGTTGYFYRPRYGMRWGIRTSIEDVKAELETRA